MKLFFIDETERQKDEQRSRAYFILCGLIIDGNDLVKAEDEFEKIRKRYHVGSLRAARKERLNRGEKIEITNAIFSVLKKYNVEVRTIYLGEPTMRIKREIGDTYLGAIDFLIERFSLSLKRDATTGIVIMDSLNHKTEDKLRKKFFNYIQSESQVWLRSGEVNPYKDRICPWLLFSNDETNSLLQATDLIASSLNGAIWNSDRNTGINVEELPEKNEYLKIYWPLFARNGREKVNGWGIKIWN